MMPVMVPEAAAAPLVVKITVTLTCVDCKYLCRAKSRGIRNDPVG
jgi:hypothetical protein